VTEARDCSKREADKGAEVDGSKTRETGLVRIRMKVLLQGRSSRSIAVSPGGDQVQIDATANALRTVAGVEVHVSPDLEPDLGKFDAVHLFGLVRPQETWVQARNAYRQGKPIILSTVYCDVWEFERVARAGPVGWIARHSNRDIIEALKAAGRGLNSREWSRGSVALFNRGFSRMQRELISMSSSLLPNSHSEWLRIARDLGLKQSDRRVVVVPNGFDAEARSSLARGGAPPDHLAALENCVLCVARIEGRKNQLNLIEAVRGTDITLVLAGPATANQSHYVRLVNKAASAIDNVHMLGKVSGEEKAWLYAVAGVHVLPSWMETTGLSSLEAAVAGCAIVVTPNGDTREYFADDVEYCDPAEPSSIRDAILRSRDRGPSSALIRRIRAEYTWERAAEVTYGAYHDVVESWLASGRTR
jgi:glycosyltransferase involved in cell wall biosynthesis